MPFINMKGDGFTVSDTSSPVSFTTAFSHSTECLENEREFKEHKMKNKFFFFGLVIFFLFVFFFAVSRSRFVSSVSKPASQVRSSRVNVAMVTPVVLGVVNNSVDANVGSGVQVNVA